MTVKNSRRICLFNRFKRQILWDIPSPTNDPQMLVIKKVPLTDTLYLLKDSKFISVINVTKQRGFAFKLFESPLEVMQSTKYFMDLWHVPTEAVPDQLELHTLQYHNMASSIKRHVFSASQLQSLTNGFIENA